jgi:hypothetical protein
MTTVLPLIGGELMARGAQFMVWIDGHAYFRVTLDVGTVAGFACHAFGGVLTGAPLEAGCMALQALKFTAQFLPVLLEDGRRECMGVTGDLPLLMKIFMALGAFLWSAVIS